MVVLLLKREGGGIMRENILAGAYTKTGISVAYGGDGNACSI